MGDSKAKTNCGSALLMNKLNKARFPGLTIDIWSDTSSRRQIGSSASFLRMNRGYTTTTLVSLYCSRKNEDHKDSSISSCHFMWTRGLSHLSKSLRDGQPNSVFWGFSRSLHSDLLICSNDIKIDTLCLGGIISHCDCSWEEGKTITLDQLESPTRITARFLLSSLRCENSNGRGSLRRLTSKGIEKKSQDKNGLGIRQRSATAYFRTNFAPQLFWLCR